MSPTAKRLINDPAHMKLCSVISLWEIAIKSGLRRPDFLYDPRVIREAAKRSGFVELPIRGEHALAVATLPQIHRDPFDRLLIAQAAAEGAILLTSDNTIAKYSDAIQLV